MGEADPHGGCPQMSGIPRGAIEDSGTRVCPSGKGWFGSVTHRRTFQGDGRRGDIRASGLPTVAFDSRSSDN